MTAPSHWRPDQLAALEARRCPEPECAALLPNHLKGCPRVPMPDPGAETCECTYPAGSLGCRMSDHAPLPPEPVDDVDVEMDLYVYAKYGRRGRPETVPVGGLL
jgi:hypothetical protein